MQCRKCTEYFNNKRLKSTISHVRSPQGHDLIEIDGNMRGRKMLLRERNIWTLALTRQCTSYSWTLCLSLQIVSVKGMEPLGWFQGCTAVQGNKKNMADFRVKNISSIQQPTAYMKNQLGKLYLGMRPLLKLHLSIDPPFFTVGCLSTAHWYHIIEVRIWDNVLTSCYLLEVN